MKEVCGFLLVLWVAAGSAFAAIPAVGAGGIVNHFSYAASQLPNGGIAQGSIFDIYGVNIGPAKLTQFTGYPVPTKIQDTSVQVTVNGTTVDVYLFFVSAGQIVGVLPSRTPVGTGTLTVTVAGQKSAPAPIQVVAMSIGILSSNQAGNGPAVMQIPDTKGNVPLNSPTKSIKPKQIGVIYGTGAGPVSFNETQGAPFKDLSSTIKAFVDGKPAKLTFAGRTPGFVGLDQFNIQIPDGLSGCYLPVAFQTGNVISNFTTISVAASGTCPDPIVTQPPLTGKGKALGIGLTRSSVTSPLDDTKLLTVDAAGASASETDYSKLPASPAKSYVYIGTCFVQTIPQPQGSGAPSDAVAYLDMGSLTITGPKGVKHLTKNPFGFGDILGPTPTPGQVPVPPPLYLEPGTYTADNGSGGPDVAAFKVSLTHPVNLDWTNGDSIKWTKETPNTIPRSQGLEVTWTGADPDTLVYIGGTAYAPRPDPSLPRSGVLFTCSEQGNVGHFTVPPLVLMSLPPSTVVNGQTNAAMQVSNGTTVPFSVSGFTGSFTLTSGVSYAVLFQ